MRKMANMGQRQGIWEVIRLLRQVPLSVYVFPILFAAVMYVLLGAAMWLLVTPIWKELAGEWDVVGKFVALVGWIIAFPVIFNLLLSIVVGFAFDPLASAIDQRLHSADHRSTPLGQQLSDGIIRTVVLLILQFIAFSVGIVIPVVGLAVSGAVSVLTALLLVTTPAFVHRGVRFLPQVKVMVRSLGVREILFGVAAAVVLNNPLLQVITLVPLIVMGQLFSRKWLVD